MRGSRWLALAALVAIAVLLVLGATCPTWPSMLNGSLYSHQPYGATAVLAVAEPRFTVLQIADTQIGGMDDACVDAAPGPCGVADTTAFVRHAVAQANPDLVVFTGDSVSRSQNPKAAFEAAWGPVIDAGVPFVVVFGNHDVDTCGGWDYATTRAYMAARALLVGTSLLSVRYDGATVLNLWFFDYVYDSSVDGYTTTPASHVAWYSDRTATETAPGLAFLHVPLPEYTDSPVVSGDRNEEEAPADANSGLYAAFDAKVHAVSVGHEHTNDYCATGTGPTMCYAGGAGYTTYGKLGWPRRARVFEWTAAGLETYKILDHLDGKVDLLTL